MDFLIPPPDIGWDLERLETPSPKPTPGPTPGPTRRTKRPTSGPTEGPTSGPTDGPTTSPSQGPTTPPPVLVEEEDAPPVIIASTPFPTEAPTDSRGPTTTTTTAFFWPPQPQEPQDAAPPADLPTHAPTLDPDSPPEVVVRTFYSCPPPEPLTVKARDRTGTEVTFEVPEPISTVRIDYEFQIQLLELEDLEEEEDEVDFVESLLPQLEDRLGESLARYMDSRTANDERGDDEEGGCEGYYVDDFRRRRRRAQRRRTRAAGEDGEQEQQRTRIIAIESSANLSIDEEGVCVPQNDGCYVVRGEYDATYVGFNEAGVKSAVSRAVRDEMTEGGGDDDVSSSYELSFLGFRDELTRSAEPEISAINVAEVMTEAVENSPFTGYGIGILVALGSAFLMLAYVILVKSEATDNVLEQMDERKEKKKQKRQALGEKDGERVFQAPTADQSYCYDLESVAIVEEERYGGGDDQDGGSEGVEVRSVQSGGSGSLRSGSAVTRKISNRAADANRAAAAREEQYGLSVSEDEDPSYLPTRFAPLTEGRYGRSIFDDEESSCAPTAASGEETGPRAVSNADAGCSVHSSSSVRSCRRGSESSSHGSGSLDDGGEVPRMSVVVDRLPPSPDVFAASSRVSPVSAGSAGGRKLSSISEAELPPPMNDTPHMNNFRHRMPPASVARDYYTGLEETEAFYEECEM